MALKKLSKSYGTSYAGLQASLRDMSGQPARYYGMPDGILPVPNGQITLNAQGGFGVYVDDSKLYKVVIYGSTPGVDMLTDLNIEVDSASASNGLTAAQVEAGATSVVGVTNSGTLVNGVGTPVSGDGNVPTTVAAAMAGIVPDGVQLTDVTASNSATCALQSASATFTQADVGKCCVLMPYTDTQQTARYGTITAVAGANNATASLSGAPGALTNAILFYGTDNGAAIDAALAAAAAGKNRGG